MPSAQDPFYVVKEEIQESVSFALMGWGLNFFYYLKCRSLIRYF